MKKFWTSLCLVLTLGLGMPLAASAGDVLAKIGDTEITEEDLQPVIGSQLLSIEQRRHQLLESGLEQVVGSKLIEMAAAERGVSVEELEAEITAAASADPTDEEVDAFYNERSDRINQPKEQVADQIKAYLKQQSGQNARAEFIDELRGKYDVTTYLEPLRMEVAATGPAKGPEDAPVTIVEFSDFECPFCSRVNPTLDEVMENYGEKVRIVFRQFPLPMHSNAKKAGEASLCADDQGKFWELHDAMFADQRNLGVDGLKGMAETLGLETETFNECLDSGKYAAQVETDLAEGAAVGVTGTPAMFINGRFISGAVPYDQLATVIDQELEAAMQDTSSK